MGDTLEKMRQAEGFVEKVKKYPGVEEIALVGSVAVGDRYAQDLDLAIVVSDFSHIEKIARAARQMGRISNHWDVFVFNTQPEYLGSICFRRECPVRSVDCSVPHCGEIPHIRRVNGFRFDEKEMFSRKVEILWVRKKSILLEWHKKVLKDLNLKNPVEYEKFEDQTLVCFDCGKEFVWDGGEQKYFKERGWNPPRRCPGCRPAKCLVCNAPLFMTRREAEEKDIELCDECECQTLAGEEGAEEE